MWTKDRVPNQSGKIAIVTGANSGIGFEVASALFEKGAHVILACRDMAKAEAAMLKIITRGGSGSMESAHLDLSSIAQVDAFVFEVASRYKKLDLLINNAGVMLPPASLTEDGYELQFGVNFLGHYVLTTTLLPLLAAAENGRVVNVSSGAHTLVNEIDFDNLRLEKPYDAQLSYAYSKLANLQFSFELNRFLQSEHSSAISIGAHPGVTESDLARHMDKATYNDAVSRFGGVMPTWQGALPILYAATAPEARGGAYYGPDGEHGLHGFPAEVEPSPSAQNGLQAAKLWEWVSSSILGACK